MAQVISPFTPVGATVNLSVTDTTGNVALSVLGDAGIGSRSVRLYNAGSNIIFINFGGSTVEAAAASSLPLPPGAVEYFEIGVGITYVAGICATGLTSTLYATEGQGA